MKMWKKIAGSLLTAGLVFGMTASAAMAADAQTGKGYTYKVTLSAGDKGVLPGDVSVEASYGDNVRFDLSQVQVTDDKYYVKGIRPSGRDYAESGTSAGGDYFSTIPMVVGDADYVVAYGIKGDQVAYTVNYRDAAGNELAPSDVFYGNIGDKPVVAYKYIEGYVPQALALAKTLSADESENVFTFEYAPGETPTVTETTTTVATVVPGAAAPAAGAAAPAGGAPGAAGAEDAETAVVPDEDVPLENQDVVDLDDEETPLADIDAGKTAKGMPMAASIATAVVAAGALGALVIVFLKKKRNISK